MSIDHFGKPLVEVEDVGSDGNGSRFGTWIGHSNLVTEMRQVKGKEKITEGTVIRFGNASGFYQFLEEKPRDALYVQEPIPSSAGLPNDGGGSSAATSVDGPNPYIVGGSGTGDEANNKNNSNNNNSNNHHVHVPLPPVGILSLAAGVSNISAAMQGPIRTASPGEFGNLLYSSVCSRIDVT
jgi:hypothetical protein